MKKLLITIAAAALVGAPFAAGAQDRDGYRGDGRAAHARSAMGRGYDANARAGSRYGQRNGGARFAGDTGRDRFVRGGFDRGGLQRGFDDRRFDRGFDRRDGGRFGGDVVLGFGYGGYPYGGYPYGGYYDAGGYPYGDDYDAGDYSYGGYGADDAYSYPDAYGAYQPFDYSYSSQDDAYYAGGTPYGGGYSYGGAGSYGYQVPPNAGWSAGGPPVDCGQWLWRQDRGAYQWVPAPCARAPYGG